MRIILIRNATHIGEEKHFWADKEIGLSEKGKREAQLLCERLKEENPKAIYSSDFLRAIETVQPLAAELRLEITKSSSFRPFNVGKYFGWTQQATVEALGKEIWQEIITNPNPQKRYFEDGETLEEEAERAWGSFEEVLKNHSKEDTIIISTHLTVIGSLLCKISGISLNNIWFWGGTMAADHPSFTIISSKQGGWYLQHYGCAEHLFKSNRL